MFSAIVPPPPPLGILVPPYGEGQKYGENMGGIWGVFQVLFPHISPIWGIYGGKPRGSSGGSSQQFSSFCFSQGVKSATDRGRLAPCRAISPRRFLQRGNARLKCSSQTTKGAVRVPTATFFKSE